MRRRKNENRREKSTIKKRVFVKQGTGCGSGGVNKCRDVRVDTGKGERPRRRGREKKEREVELRGVQG